VLLLYRFDVASHFFYYVEIMPKGGTLGEFEQLVLLAIVRLGDAAYGMRVRREIGRRTGRETSIGAVYGTLDRLAAKGLVESIIGDPTAERGGRAKRSFRLTGTGAVALNRTREELAAMLDGLAFPLPGGTW
jgi:DNA-binding PadR family transcriptional regulator